MGPKMFGCLALVAALCAAPAFAAEQAGAEKSETAKPRESTNVKQEPKADDKGAGDADDGFSDEAWDGRGSAAKRENGVHKKTAQTREEDRAGETPAGKVEAKEPAKPSEQTAKDKAASGRSEPAKPVAPRAATTKTEATKTETIKPGAAKVETSAAGAGTGNTAKAKPATSQRGVSARAAPERRAADRRLDREPQRRPVSARPARAPAEPDRMIVAAASQSATPISGGIVCGAPAKFRCNARAPGFDKFYKFSKGHSWTDQTMATDFCASEKEMRVASVTRTLSAEAGCCGIVVVQVTCKR